MKKMKEIRMSEIPNCDFCDNPAKYDAPTIMGPWAYLCQLHFDKYARKPSPGSILREVKK